MIHFYIMLKLLLKNARRFFQFWFCLFLGLWRNIITTLFKQIKSIKGFSLFCDL